MQPGPLIIYIKETSIALLNYIFRTDGLTAPEPVIINMPDKELIKST
jgi:hypothetical protein